MRFCDIPGHETEKARLIDLVDRKIMPHALLLEGPSGIGKFMLARALAQYIHCENRSNGDSCGKCASCMQHETFNHIDTIYSFPVIKRKSTETVTSGDYMSEFKEMVAESPFMDMDIWSALINSENKQPVIYVDEGSELNRRLSYHTRQSQYKIVLIWLPERMNEETANKMLKLIEEPTDDTLFILSSDNSKALLPTIYSRVQRLKVNKYEESAIADYLESNCAIEPSEAVSIAHLADGSIGAALSLTGVSKQRKLFLDMFMDLMRKAYQRKVILLRKWSSDAAKLKREKSLAFVDYCAHMIRENFIMNMQVSQLNRLSVEEQNFSKNFARFINERNVLKFFEMFNQAKIDISGNANLDMVFFDIAVRSILLIKL